MMEWKTWVLFLTVIMEALGSAFFFDTFLGRGKTETASVCAWVCSAWQEHL